MKTKSFTYLFYLLFIFCGISFTSFAQQAKTIQLKSVAVTPSRGANPKIKSDVPVSDSHPVAKARGGCRYKFDNYTGLYIKVYVDGYYKGTIDPWGSASMNVTSGYMKVYLVSAGGTREWNSSGDCNSAYTYSLR